MAPKLVYTPAIDRLKALIDEARWVLTDSDLERLKPVQTPAEIEQAINLIRYGLMDEAGMLAANPFRDGDWAAAPDYSLLRVLRDPEYFPYAVYHLFRKPDGQPVRLMPFQHLALMEFWWRQLVMLVASRGAGKSWLLAVYILLKLTFHQGTEIAVVSKTLRQSKILYSYCERLWNNSPVFRSLVGEGAPKRNGPRPAMSEGRYEFVIGDSIALFLPLGPDGEGIRGIRSQCTITDEFGCLDYNTIVETDRGMVRIGEWAERGGDHLVRPGLPPAPPAKFFTTPPVDAYRVTTANGFNFTCSAIHKVMTQDGWKLAKDLTAEDYLEQKNEYAFPTAYVERDGLVVDEQVGWLLGALVAEGAVNHKGRVTVTSTDPSYTARAAAALAALAPDRQVAVDAKTPGDDSRGWENKPRYDARLHCVELRDRLAALGLDRATAVDKKVPWAILQSPRPVVLAFLAGLLEGDGSAFLWGDPGKPKDRLGVAFYSSSEQLADDVHVLLLKLGAVANKQSRASKLSPRPQWMLRLNGEYAIDLLNQLGVPKWADLPAKVVTPRLKSKAGVVWTRYGRGRKNSGWRATRTVGSRTKCVGFFATREEALAALEPYRQTRYLKVKGVEKLCGQRVLYDFTVPPEHAFFGNGFVQHNSLNPEVYSVVVAGFGAVASDPVYKAGEHARAAIMQRLGLWTQEQEGGLAALSAGNQQIIAGTATYQFNHFYQYLQSYREVIRSGGDPERVRAIFKGDPPPGFDWRRYSIIRLPWSMIPKGMMDAGTIGRAKQLAATNEYQREYEASFPADSDGFFRRSNIEKCTVGGLALPPPEFPSGTADFSAARAGDPLRQYVYGVDPAAVNDNFAVVVEELWPEHRRVVHCWTTKRSEHRRAVASGGGSADFYQYAADQLRAMFAKWPPRAVVIDAGGGGLSIQEKFRNPGPGEVGYYAADDEEAAHLPGEHILTMFQFANGNDVTEANWGLQKDLESRALLFPRSSALDYALAEAADRAAGDDGLVDALHEIDQLKDELTTIVREELPSGRERWDVPGGPRGEVRKDRYSALVMANWMAKRIGGAVPAPERPEAYGGAVAELAGRKREDDGSSSLYVLTEACDPKIRAKARGSWYGG